jgi:hypothetical protein
VSLTALQRVYGPGLFEYGIVRSFSGRIEAEPQPMLVVPRAGAAGGEPAPASRYLLAAPGKSGAAPLVREWDGRDVTPKGSVVCREGRTLVEVVPGSIEPSLTRIALAADEPIPLGSVMLAGGIVDSKCWLGVMNPGSAKPHRACAVRCLSGGIVQMLLVAENGGPLNAEVLDLVAEPVEIRGNAERRGDLLVLRASRGDIHRVG